MAALDSPSSSSSSPSPAGNKLERFASSFMIGGVAAAASKSTVAPLDRVKLLLQVQHSHSDIAPERRYAGIVDALRRIPREQGIASLWRGNLTNVARSFPTQALNFAFNDAYKRALTSGVDAKRDAWSYGARVWLAGGLAGCSSLCFVYPLDFVRTRLAVDIGRESVDRRFLGFTDCVRKTLAERGPRGLYTGFSLSVQTYFVYRSTYFGLYDIVRRRLDSPRADGRLHFAVAFLVAEAVTMVASLLTYPWDTVRRRLMIAEKSGVTPDHAMSYGTRAWQAARRIARAEGMLGFYRGAGANVLRSSGGALVMAIYEEAHKHIEASHLMPQQRLAH